MLISLLSLLASVSLLSIDQHPESSGRQAAPFFHTNPVYEENGYPFSLAVEADGWVFLSGALGTLPNSIELAPGGIEGEARQVMDNIQASLAELDLTMADIVKCTIMIDDMSDWPAFNAVYASYFDGRYPARSAFGADGLALGALVEVECIAKR
jgi:reactive intermediate/imine deaminase